MPARLTGQFYVVKTYKIIPRNKPTQQSWQRSIKALEEEFRILKKIRKRDTKWYGSSQIIGAQRTSRTRSKNQRKLFRKQLDKIDTLLEKMKRSERDVAIKNLQSRIYSLKKRLAEAQ